MSTLSTTPMVEAEVGLEKSGRAEDLVKLYESRSRLVPHADEAAHLLCRAADVCRDRLKDVPRAEALLRRAIIYAPHARHALEGLRQIYETRNDFGALVHVLEQLAVGLSGPDAAAMYVRAGELYESKLQRKERAILCYQQASRAAPHDRLAYQRVRKLLLETGRYGAVFDSLERERSSLGGRELLGEYLALASALVEYPQEHGLATQALMQALSIDEGNAQAIETQRALSRLESHWRDSARRLKAQSMEERDRKVAARMALQAARLSAYYEPAAVEKVQEALERCFALWPAMPEAIDLLEKVAVDAGDVTLAATTLQKLAGESRDRQAKAEFLVRLGQIRLAKMGDSAGAAAAFSEASECDASRADAAELACEALLAIGKPADAMAAIERHLKTLKDKSAQVALRLNLADLAQKSLHDAAAVKAQVQQAHQLDPQNAQVAYRLASLYVEEGALEALWPILELASSAPRPVKDRVSLCELAALLAEEQGDHLKHFQALALALPLAPERGDVLSGLLAAAEKAQTQEALLESLRRAAQMAGPEVQVSLWRTLGSLLQGLGRASEAREVWLEIQKRIPDDVEAESALVELRRQVVAAPNDDRSRLEADARGLETTAADPAAAAEVYRKILALEPDSVGTLQKLFAATTSLAQWAEAAEVAERLAALAASSNERQEWRARVGQLFAERLHRRDEAAQVYLNLLEEGDDRPAVVGGLERLAAGGVRPSEISRALAPVYERAQDYQRQFASLLVQLPTVKERDAQRSLLALLAEISETRLLDERGAYDFRVRTLSLDPQDSTARAQAARLAKTLNIQPELAHSLSQLALKADHEDLVVSLTLDASELAEEAEAIDEAAQVLRRGLERLPRQRELLIRLSELLLGARRWAEVEPVLRERWAHAAGPERIAVGLTLAQVNRELGRPREAASVLSDAIEAGANAGEQLPRLATLLEEGAQWRELTDVQARLIEWHTQHGDHDRAAALAVQRAQLIERVLGDKAAAIDRYAEILSQRPTDADALAALEGLLTDPEHQEAAARALLATYETVKDHRKQVGALSIIATASKDALERLTALKRSAEISTVALRQPEQAFAALATAMRLAPEDRDIRVAARAAATDADALDTYAEVLEELVQSATGSAAIELRCELADVLEKKLNQHGAAIEQLEAVLEIDGNHLDVLRTLQRLYRSRDDAAKLLGIIERLVPLEQEMGPKASLHREAALVAEEKLKELDRASTHWRQIAARDALSREAATNLERLYIELDRPEALAFALELRRNQEGQSPLGREVAFRLAALRQNRLGDPRGALESYRQILSEDPSHEGARDALEVWARGNDPEFAAAAEILDDVLARTGDHQRRIALREARLTQASTHTERVRLSGEIRIILERDLNQPEAAFMSALKAFTDGLDREGIQPELERLARATDAYADLAEIYESTADELKPDDPARVALLRRAAEVREQLSETDEATRLWKAVLDSLPEDRQALTSLSKLYELAQNAQNLSDIYARQAAITTLPHDRFEILLKAAEAFEAAGNDAQAIESLKQALTIDRSFEVMKRLERLLGRAHRRLEQADVLSMLLESAADDAGRVSLLVKRGRLLEHEGQVAEAVQAFSEVLSLSDTEPEVIAALERLLPVESVRFEVARLLERAYRLLNDGRRLVEVLDIRVIGAEPAQRLAYLGEVAHLRESLGQKNLALTAWLKAFAEKPDDAQAREALERVATDLGAYEELTGAYEDALERGVGEPLGSELWRRLAVVYGDRLAQYGSAAKAWNEVLARHPQDMSVLEQLGRIFRQTSQFRELSVVMRRQLGLEKNVVTQVSWLFELAALAEEQLADKSLAIQCYQSILERSPEDESATQALTRLLAETEAWPDLAVLLSKQIQRAETQEKEEEALELMVRLGRLKVTRLGDPRGGLTIFQEVLRRKPAHAGAIGALEEMARSDNSLKGEAASTLEPVFASEGEHLKLVQMLEARAAAESQVTERAALLRKVAQVYAEQLGNAEMAFVAAARALKELPDESASLDLVSALAKKADAEDEMMALLAEVAPRASHDGSRANLYRTLARHQAQADEENAAIESWKRVTELAPTDAEAMGQLGQLFARQGRIDELLEVLKRQLAIEEETERRVALLLQISQVQEEQLKEPHTALGTLRRVLELAPDYPPALVRMERLCEAQQRWPELADVLARRIKTGASKAGHDVADTRAQEELIFRLATIRESKLLDKAGAIELYHELLGQNPRHAGSIERLAALAQREPQNTPVFEALAQAYRQGGELSPLAMLLESRVGVSPDPQERKALLVELARLREVQGEPELGYLAYYRAFKEDPNDAEVRKQFCAAGVAAASFDELAGALKAELPRLAELNDVAEVAVIIGQLCEQRLGEKEEAVKYYEKAREAHAPTAVKALPALDRLYGELKELEKQAEVIAVEASLVTEPQDKVGLFYRLGQLSMDALDNPDRAAGAFEKVLEADPRHLPSLRSLEMLYEEAKASTKLYRVLEAQRDLVQGAERDRILAKMAQTSAEGLDNPEHSATLYRELLEKNPRNEQAFDSLAALLERMGKGDELKALLEWKLQFTVDPRELVRINERLGQSLWQQLKRPEEAIPYFKSALERDARHRGALEALRDIYLELKRRDDLVVILRRLIPLQEDAQGVKQLRIQLAELMAELNRREESLDAGRRALEVEPHQPSELDRLLKVFRELNAWPDAVRALEGKVAYLLEQEERDAAVQTMFEVVEIWSGPGNKPDLAGTALNRLLEIEPSNRQAYTQALALFERLHDWRSYAQVMDRYLPYLVTDDERVTALRELAKVQESKLGAKHVAFLQCCRALQLSPASEELRADVERLAADTGSYEELAAVYEELAEAVPRGPIAERLYLTLAAVQDNKLDDPGEAESSYRKILEFDPTNQTALERLAAMFARRGFDSEYVIALEQQMETAGSIERRKEILREIARIYDERLENRGEAENALVRALELEPDLETLGVLASLQRRQGNFAAVASTLMRMRDIAPTPDERARLQVEVAQVFERDLGDDEAAAQAYRLALEFAPAHTQALVALEQLYSKLDQPAELLAVYQRQAEVATDYRERVKVLFRSATIWEERFSNLANADACIEAALQTDPQNLAAIKTLERLRKAQGRWDELVGVVDRHIQLLHNPKEKAELCVEIGDVFYQQLKAGDRAAVAYHQALELDPECLPALHALGVLYERSGNWPFALEMLEREAKVLAEKPEAVEVWYRVGKINEDMLGDGANAKRAYLEAVHLKANFLPALRALKSLYEAEQDFESYEKTLLEEARQTEDPQERSRACIAVGQFYQRQENQEKATAFFEEALRFDPQALEAAQPLADIYMSTEQWEACERMLDIVTARLLELYATKPDDADLARELCRRQYRLGYVCEKNGRPEKALPAYERAYQLDATYLPVLEGYGHLLAATKRHEEAQRVYQSILVHHRGELTDLEVAEIYWMLGDLHLQLQQFDRAENHFEKALAIDSAHEPSLRSMITLMDQAQKFDRSVEFQQKLVAALDGEAKYEASVVLGACARDKLSDPYVAIDAYAAALRVHPDALDVLDALYVLYRETKQGPKAAEVLETMLTVPALQADPQRAKRVWYALGEINRDELHDVDRALKCFNSALDADWRFMEALSAIEQMLGREKKWSLLDENYRQMLARIPKTPPTHAVRMNLWKALGDLYLNALKSPETAVQVYKVVASGLPDDTDVQEQYATLAQRQPGYEQEAVVAWRRALPGTGNPARAASALAELAAKRKDYDSAWIAASVMAGLIGDPGPGEKEILTKLGPHAKKREVAQRQLTDRLWSEHLFHPKVRGPLGDLMAILFEQGGGLYKEDFSRYGIVPKRHHIEVNGALEYQLHHFRYVAKVLGMEQVAVFSPFLAATRERLAKRSTEPAPDPLVSVELCHTDPVGIRLGGKFFNDSTSQHDAYYLLGRTMAYLRPELALSQRLSGERLEAVVQAAISLSVDRFRFTADLKLIETERRALERHLTAQAKDALARVTKDYVKVATSGDLRNFLEGAELSATRTGAFLAGDIEAVKRLVMSETGPQFRVAPRSKIRDLMVFALGEDLHALRVAVGTNVEVQLRK